MGCLLAILAAISPRFVIVLLAIFNYPYVARAFNGFLIPLLGFIFLPFTTLIYIVVYNPITHGLSGWGMFWVLLAFLIDLGTYGNGYRNRNGMNSKAY